LCIVALLAVATPALADLTAQQKGLLSAIASRVKMAEVNLKAAEDAAGPATAKPSETATRLALNRSGSAQAQLDSAKDALKRLPASDPAVKEMLDRAAAIDQSIAALEKRLGAEGPAPAAPVGMKLDFRQEKVLKDAEFYLREMDGAAQFLAGVVEKVKAAKDPDQLDHRLLADAMATADKARERKKLTDGYFGQLPKDGAGVAATSGKIDQAMAGVEAASKTLMPVHERLQKLVSPASYPKLEEDLARIQGLGRMLSDTQVLQQNPNRAADVVKQLPAAKEELATFGKTYGVLVTQQTDAGKRISGVTAFLTGNLATFDAAAAARRKALPAEIRDDLDQAMKLADEAAREKKPRFFTGGIPQRLGHAEQKVVLYTALDEQGAPAIAKTVADAREQIKQKQASLSDAIIASNPLPPDRYTGADKAALSAKAIEAWKKAQPDAQVLAVRIPSEKWSRESLWRRQSATWYLIDRSALQAQLVIKHDAKLAVVRAINLWTDHLDGDKVSAFPLHDPKDPPQPQDLLLLEVVK
jgi:hypothetical protein